MNLDCVCLGTWLPRTSIHLKEIYNFLKTGSGVDLDISKLQHLRNLLSIKDLSFHSNYDFNTLKFYSGNIEVIITEDGVILMMIHNVGDISNEIGNIESFYTDKLGPALSYLFSRGAPLPQTLLNIKEVYPKIFVGQDLKPKEIETYLKEHHDTLLTKISSGKLNLFYGEESEFIDIPANHTKKNYDELLDQLLTCSIFIRSFSDLLDRYLSLHRSVWTEISSIRENKNLRYRDFTLIRNEILDILKTISFIRVRLQQMNDILSLRNTFTSEALKQKLSILGLSSFTTLEKSCQYMDNLWKMTEDYGNSTMILFESLLEENAQREVRLLQQITVASMLVGFFGMNIAFPWEERWQDVFVSSFIVVGVITITLGLFYLLIKKVILNRRFSVLNK